MADMPNLEIDGKVYTTARPTMKTWRDFEKHAQERLKFGTLLEVFEDDLRVLKEFYGVPTEELEKMAVEDVLPAYNALAEAIVGMALEKLGKIPNAEKGEVNT